MKLLNSHFDRSIRLTLIMPKGKINLWFLMSCIPLKKKDCGVNVKSLTMSLMLIKCTITKSLRDIVSKEKTDTKVFLQELETRYHKRDKEEVSDGYYVTYNLIKVLCILFIFIKRKFIHCYSCVMFAMKFMRIFND